MAPYIGILTRSERRSVSASTFSNNGQLCASWTSGLPGGNDEQVESIPRVGEVRCAPDETHRHHLDAQFDGEEDEDEVIEAFEDAAARRRAHLVAARLVHAQRYAVEQDHAHADPLKPRAVSGQGVRLIQQKLEMWANAQRDGRPTEYRWRPLFNAAAWLTPPTSRVPCSNAAKTRNPLKFAGVPQTNETISAASGPKFTIL